jgi:nucleoside-triphosphatase THEP1
MVDIDDRSAAHMTTTLAAVLYTPRQADKSALPELVMQLKADGVSVAGILQESRLDRDTGTRIIESVDINTGHRIPIKQPVLNETECGLDVANLAETSAILRDAVRARPDLVVIEKFGDQEQKGEGLLDEIMQIIVEDIPLLIAVPEPALEIWQRQCGDMGVTLPYTLEAMLEWWRETSKPKINNGDTISPQS